MRKRAHWSFGLKNISACHESRRWARKKRSLLAAWRGCRKGSWMMFLVAECGVDYDLQRRLRSRLDRDAPNIWGMFSGWHFSVSAAVDEGRDAKSANLIREMLPRPPALVYEGLGLRVPRVR